TYGHNTAMRRSFAETGQIGGGASGFVSIPARVMLKHVYDRREGGPVADASSDVTTNEINVTREGQSDLENIQQALECLLRKIDALEERLDATQGPRPLLTRQDV